MSHFPFFSVILPTYNRAHLITETIQSILDQTFNDFEIVVVDDGSIDATESVIAQINDHRIHYIYQENAERCVARNTGITNAKGKFICFLDSDDLYKKNHLKMLYDEIIKNKEQVGMYVTNVTRYQDGISTDVPHEDAKTHVNNACYVLLAKESIIPARVCISASILKEEKFESNLNVILGEDAELFIRILKKHPLFQINQHTVIYQLHSENSTNLKHNIFLGQARSLKRIFELDNKAQLIPNSLRRKKWSNCYAGIARFHEHNREWFKMSYYYMKSILITPKSKSNHWKLATIIKGIQWLWK